MNKAKLVYICGMGHNGSTALDLLLDGSEDCIGTSQLNDLLVLYDPYEAENGRPEFVNDFWTQLLKELSEEQKQDLSSENNAVLKEKRILDFTFSARKRQRYAEANGRLISALSETVGGKTIIDSSKNISRVLGLLESSGIEVYVVHLTRDVRGYVGSHNKRRQENGKRLAYFAPTMIWFAKNVAASLLAKPKAKNYLHVRYEEMMLQPDQFLTKLGEFIGHRLDQCKPVLRGQEPLRSSQSLGFLGNRVLQNREDVFLDPSRVRGNQLYDSKIYWCLLGWVSMFWGYRFK